MGREKNRKRDRQMQRKVDIEGGKMDTERAREEKKVVKPKYKAIFTPVLL